MPMHKNQRMSRRELAFGAAFAVGVTTCNLSSQVRKADYTRELNNFKARMEFAQIEGSFNSHREEFNAEVHQLNGQRESISSFALRDGAISGGGLLLIVALWFSIKAFRSKLNKWRARLREFRCKERAERRRKEDRPFTVPTTSEPATIATERTPTHVVQPSFVKPTPKPHPVRPVDKIKQALFDALKSKLNGLAGPVAEALIDNLDRGRLSAIIKNPALLKDLVEEKPAEFAEMFRRKGIKVCRVLEALNKQDVQKPTPVIIPSGNVSIIDTRIEVLRTIGLHRGIKPRDLVLQLTDAGFEARTAPGRGGNGHRILFYEGEIVRSSDGRSRYVPHANTTPVKDVVLTEIVRTAVAFLEKRKGELAAA